MDFTTRDQDHINMLAIFYWVFGGLGVLTTILLAIYFAFMGVMLKQIASQAGGAGGQADLTALSSMSTLMFALFGVLIVFGLISAILKIVAGFYLKKRKGYIFCLIVAGLTCLSLPLGTILGIFTFIVLMRTQVARAFRTGEAAVQMVPVHYAYPAPNQAPPPPPA